MATFNPNAEEIIKEQAETVASLLQERAILRSQLRDAERQMEEHSHDASPNRAARRAKPKAVAPVE